MAELDEPVGDVCWIKPEVFGAEFLATAPVTDGGCDKDAPAAHGVEEVDVVVWIHDDFNFRGWLLVMVFREMKKAAPVREPPWRWEGLRPWISSKFYDTMRPEISMSSSFHESAQRARNAGTVGEVTSCSCCCEIPPQASVETTMIYLHVIKRPGAGGPSLLDLS